MKKELPLLHNSLENTFEKYEAKFKALADKKRLLTHNPFLNADKAVPIYSERLSSLFPY